MGARPQPLFPMRLGEVLLALQKEFITPIRGHDQAPWAIDVLDGNAGNTHKCVAVGALQPDGLSHKYFATHGPRDGFGPGRHDSRNTYDRLQGCACYSSGRYLSGKWCFHSWIVH